MKYRDSYKRLGEILDSLDKDSLSFGQMCDLEKEAKGILHDLQHDIENEIILRINSMPDVF